jgi:hypothetical protein
MRPNYYISSLVGRSFGKSLSCSASVRPSASIGDLPCTGRNSRPCLRGEHVFGRARRQSNPSQEKREKSKPVQAHFVVSKNMFLG